MSKLRLLIGCLIALTFVAGTTTISLLSSIPKGDYEEKLIDGYSVDKSNEYTIVIIDKWGGMIVSPCVTDLYADKVSHLIFGRTQVRASSSVPSRNDFFFLETSSAVVHWGNINDLNESLNAIGFGKFPLEKLSPVN